MPPGIPSCADDVIRQTKHQVPERKEVAVHELQAGALPRAAVDREKMPVTSKLRERLTP